MCKPRNHYSGGFFFISNSRKRPPCVGQRKNVTFFRAMEMEIPGCRYVLYACMDSKGSTMRVTPRVTQRFRIPPGRVSIHVAGKNQQVVGNRWSVKPPKITLINVIWSVDTGIRVHGHFGTESLMMARWVWRWTLSVKSAVLLSSILALHALLGRIPEKLVVVRAPSNLCSKSRLEKKKIHHHFV